MEVAFVCDWSCAKDALNAGIYNAWFRRFHMDVLGHLYSSCTL